VAADKYLQAALYGLEHLDSVFVQVLPISGFKGLNPEIRGCLFCLATNSML